MRVNGIDLGVLVWWAIPAGATLIAIVAVSFRARPKRPKDGTRAMADLHQFRSAMNRPLDRR